MKVTNSKTCLTPKQEAFARAYVELGNASKSYRQAYNVGENSKPETVWEEASRSLADPKIATRLMELHEAARERTLVTVDQLYEELKQARVVAMGKGQCGAVVTAIMGKAKLAGLGSERRHPSSATPIEVDPLINLEGLTDEELDLVERAFTILVEHGHVQQNERHTPPEITAGTVRS